MRVILYLLISLSVCQIRAQLFAPGGVTEPSHWLLSQADQNENTRWLDQVPASAQDIIVAQSQCLNLNNWLIPQWSVLSSDESIALDGKSWEAATIFTVYQAHNLAPEQALWCWEPADRAPLLCTNQRLADLEQRQYLNWPQTDQQLRLHTYYQTNKAGSASAGLFRLGQQPSNQQLPITDWTGSIAEFIFYPRVLSPQQRLQVESYLALKYGITLGVGKDYLRSDGKVIWKARQNETFHHRIFGVGHDEAGSWQQYYGQAAESPADIRISLSNAPAYNGVPGPPIPDQTIWLVGDNNAPLDWEVPTADQQILQRSWLLQTQGVASTIATNIRIDLGRWLADPQDGLTYFLAIDRSGKGHFEEAAIELIPLSHLSFGRFGHFQNIYWDIDGSGSDRFTIIRQGNIAALSPLETPTFRVYPNPLKPQGRWQWQIRFPEPVSLTTTLSNAQGQLLQEKNWSAGTYFAQEETALAAGIYLLHFHYSGKTLTQKLIVQ